MEIDEIGDKRYKCKLFTDEGREVANCFFGEGDREKLRFHSGGTGRVHGGVFIASAFSLFIASAFSIV
ncbi:hypothetical protein TSUD_305260 [Trifolium subterraneum]|uniref:Uncharacterized protein n=1 Tax=Trifolium subterraneum TaxID=3900 RepID=A0A2Z6NEF9_TRISU|nr:hypothetical protein TSUD_305260 [Trifolium subterraneum]